MYNLDTAYNKSFFKNRHKLSWRVPVVCNAITNSFPYLSSIIDFGCGIGEYVNGFLQRGIDALGVEGTVNCIDKIVCPADRIKISDLRTIINFDRRYDLAVCFEVVEHIEDEYVPNLIANFNNASDSVLISAAPPGQGGHYHVNCQSKQYWIDAMKKADYKFNSDMTDRIKSYFTHLYRKEIRCYYDNLIYFDK